MLLVESGGWQKTLLNMNIVVHRFINTIDKTFKAIALPGLVNTFKLHPGEV